VLPVFSKLSLDPGVGIDAVIPTTRWTDLDAIVIGPGLGQGGAPRRCWARCSDDSLV
jgi:hypothetical protein